MKHFYTTFPMKSHGAIRRSQPRALERLVQHVFSCTCSIVLSLVEALGILCFSCILVAISALQKVAFGHFFLMSILVGALWCRWMKSVGSDASLVLWLQSCHWWTWTSATFYLNESSCWGFMLSMHEIIGIWCFACTLVASLSLMKVAFGHLFS